MRLRSGKSTGRAPSARRKRRKKSSKALTKTIKRVMLKNMETGVVGSFTDLPAINNQTIQTLLAIGDNIPQGDNQGDRHGSEILYTGIRFHIKVRNLNPGQAGWLRILCVRRKEPNAGLNGLFTSLGNGVNGVSYAPDNRFLNRPINKALFSVKFDRKIRVLGNDPESMGRNQIQKKYWIKFNKTKLKYTVVTTNGSGTDILPNYLLLCFVCWDDDNATRTMPVHTHNWEYFKDP